MNKVPAILAAACLTAAAGVAHAQYPVMDAVANKVVQKYQNRTRIARMTAVTHSATSGQRHWYSTRATGLPASTASAI